MRSKATIALFLAYCIVCNGVQTVLPFCMLAYVGSGTNDRFCIGVENGVPVCYGANGGCPWGPYRCTDDSQCSPSLISGPKYVSASPCSDVVFTYPNTGGWGAAACYANTARPSSQPSSQPSKQPQAQPSIQPTGQPTMTPSSLLSRFLDILQSSPTYQPRIAFSFAGKDSSGKLFLWGEVNPGAVQLVLAAGTHIVAANRDSIVATDDAGSIYGWGVPGYMRNKEDFANAGIATLVGNDGAYAGIDASGATFAFGGANSGNFIPTAGGVASTVSADVIAVVASKSSFTALKSDGTVYTWGSKFCGGGVSSLTRPELQGIVKVVASTTAFAGLTSAGAVHTWGGRTAGGDSSAVAAQLQSGVVHVIAAQSVFVAFKTDLNIVAWGSKHYGGDTSTVVGQLTGGVIFVAFTSSAMAALKADGSVVTWGDVKCGGDSSAVQAQLTGITKIYGNHYAFAALKEDGSMVTWGDEQDGGSIPADLTASLSAGVTEVFSTHRAFAALKGATGELVVWGNAYFGGDAGAADSYLSSGVRTVCSNEVAFTAILQDGRAVAWGHSTAVAVPGLLTMPAGESFDGIQACI